MARPRGLFGLRACRRLALAVALAALAAGAAEPEPIEPLVPLRQGERWGYADRAGKVVVAPEYDRVTRFDDGLARVARAGKWGAIDRQGRVVVPLEFDRLGPFAEGYAPACRDTDRPSGVTEGVGRGQRDVKVQACGFVDRSGRLAVPLRYTGVNWFEHGVAQVQLRRESPCLVASEWGLVDATGREVLPVRYCYVSPPSEGLVKVIYEEPSLEVRRFGFHSLDGRVAIPKLPYDGSHEAWSEGLLGVRRAQRFGFIDHAGREVIPLRFGSAFPFAEGLAAAELDGKWGFVDRTGALAVPAIYDEVGTFREGLAWARRGDLAGFIDRSGKVVVPFAFDGWVDRQARPGWSEGLCGMKAPGGGWGFIDRSGRWVVPPEHAWVRPCREGRCAAQQGKLWGFYDLSGELAIPFRYSRVESDFADGLAYVSRRLRADLPEFAEGFIDRSGREFFDAPARPAK